MKAPSELLCILLPSLPFQRVYPGFRVYRSLAFLYSFSTYICICKQYPVLLGTILYVFFELIFTLSIIESSDVIACGYHSCSHEYRTPLCKFIIIYASILILGVWVVPRYLLLQALLVRTLTYNIDYSYSLEREYWLLEEIRLICI